MWHTFSTTFCCGSLNSATQCTKWMQWKTKNINTRILHLMYSFAPKICMQCLNKIQTKEGRESLILLKQQDCSCYKTANCLIKRMSSIHSTHCFSQQICKWKPTLKLTKLKISVAHWLHIYDNSKLKLLDRFLAKYNQKSITNSMVVNQFQVSTVHHHYSHFY
jgi:hypothetical protein